MEALSTQGQPSGQTGKPVIPSHLLDSEGNATEDALNSKRYGCTLSGDPVPAEEGWRLLASGEVILSGDQPYDIYSGWITADNYHAKNKYRARCEGRWTTWRRRCLSPDVASTNGISVEPLGNPPCQRTQVVERQGEKTL